MNKLNKFLKILLIVSIIAWAACIVIVAVVEDIDCKTVFYIAAASIIITNGSTLFEAICDDRKVKGLNNQS